MLLSLFQFLSQSPTSTVDSRQRCSVLTTDEDEEVMQDWGVFHDTPRAGVLLASSYLREYLDKVLTL